MQCYKIEITDLAKQDLDAISDYIIFKLKAPVTAFNIVKGLRATIEQLGQHPNRHRLDDDPILAAMEIRLCYYKKYKVFYMVDERQKSVIIIHVLHMRVNSRTALYRALELE